MQDQKERLRQLLARIRAMRNAVDTIDLVPSSSAEPVVTPTTPVGSMAMAEALLAQVETTVDTYNRQLRPYDRPVHLPSARTLHERIVPQLGDFLELQRFLSLLVRARFRRPETVKVGSRQFMTMVQQGPGWATLLRPIEGGHTLAEVEAVYMKRVDFPYLTIDILFEIHGLAHGDEAVFDEFFEIIKDQYDEIGTASKYRFVVHILHEIRRNFAGQLDQWVDQKLTDRGVQSPLMAVAKNVRQLPPSVRSSWEESRHDDPERDQLYQNFDRGFDPEKTRRRIGGR